MDIIITNTKVTCVKDAKVTYTSIPRMLIHIARKCFKRIRPETLKKIIIQAPTTKVPTLQSTPNRDQTISQGSHFSICPLHPTGIICLSQVHKHNVRCNAEWKRQINHLFKNVNLNLVGSLSHIPVISNQKKNKTIRLERDCGVLTQVAEIKKMSGKSRSQNQEFYNSRSK